MTDSYVAPRTCKTPKLNRGGNGERTHAGSQANPGARVAKMRSAAHASDTAASCAPRLCS